MVCLTHGQGTKSSKATSDSGLERKSGTERDRAAQQAAPPAAIAPADDNPDPFDFSVLSVDLALAPVYGTAAGRPCEARVCAFTTPSTQRFMKRVPDARRESIVPRSFVIKFHDTVLPADIGSFCASANTPGRCKNQFRSFGGTSIEITPPKLEQMRRRFRDILQYIEVDRTVSIDLSAADPCGCTQNAVTRGVTVSKVGCADHFADGKVWCYVSAGAGCLSPDVQPSLSHPGAAWKHCGTQWGLDRIDQRSLPLDLQYKAQHTGRGSTVYVVDTGVRITHSEFGGRASHGFSAFGGDSSDRHGHGTHCAGTAAGATYGVAKEANIVAVKVLGDNGMGEMSWIVAGLDWIIQNRVKDNAVVSMSLGGPSWVSVNKAVRVLTEAGVPVVVAAGNENQDASNISPASEPTAFTVAATTTSDSRAPYSNFGPSVDIFAPGSSVTSAGVVDDYSTATLSGTSQACPHVAGVMALYFERSPSAPVKEVYAAILSSATPGLVRDAQGSSNLLLFSALSHAMPTTPVYRANAYCGGAWGVDRRALLDTPSAAACQAQAEADQQCSSTFFHMASTGKCRCVLKGRACIVSAYAGMVIYKTLPAPACADEKPECRIWAAVGECTATREFMHMQCRRSCRLCGTDAPTSLPTRWLSSKRGVVYTCVTTGVSSCTASCGRSDVQKINRTCMAYSQEEIASGNPIGTPLSSKQSTISACARCSSTSIPCPPLPACTSHLATGSAAIRSAVDMRVEPVVNSTDSAQAGGETAASVASIRGVGKRKIGLIIQVAIGALMLTAAV
jgi:subtilisin family serine protease